LDPSKYSTDAKFPLTLMGILNYTDVDIDNFLYFGPAWARSKVPHLPARVLKLFRDGCDRVEMRCAYHKYLNNTEGRHSAIKAVRNAVQGCNFVTITMERGGKSGTFKIPASQMYNAYGQYRICGVSHADRDANAAVIGENLKFDITEVAKISHGRKVVYTRPEYLVK
jgi:hypothetical protein